MLDGQSFVCTKCRATIPMTNSQYVDDNPLMRKIGVHDPQIRSVTDMFLFSHNSRWRVFIHDIKYRGHYRDAFLMGYWWGMELRRSGRFDDIDVVVPVPLHPIKQMKRGYNQADYIARGVAKALDVRVKSRALRRCRNNSSQAQSSHEERWQNVENLFAVRDVRVLQDRHILLVDDVITTGATILSCVDAIVAELPNVEISITALSTTNKSYGVGA